VGHALRKHASASPLMMRELFNCIGLLMNAFVQEIFLSLPSWNIMSMAATFLFSSSSLLLSEAFVGSDFNVGIVLYIRVGLGL
jgi:hypothetical protein